MHDIGLLSVMKVKQNKIFKLFCLTYNINFYIKGLLYSKKNYVRKFYTKLLG